jgi:hypothetical protein
MPSEVPVPPAHNADFGKTRPRGGKGGAPTRCDPLLGPPGPAIGPNAEKQGWDSVPTRRNYEDHNERAWQTRYIARYGTLFPEAGVHY